MVSNRQFIFQPQEHLVATTVCCSNLQIQTAGIGRAALHSETMNCVEYFHCQTPIRCVLCPKELVIGFMSMRQNNLTKCESAR